ncbi:reverse transcriptase domain-containing protein [Rhizobium sp. YK2]|uniref:reverse transcriptase domain-containing protein n=2 Tax=Rhizobium TaxID=379 RepID=UPI0009F1A337|nr:reverse transcriptase domain-containing protein [Rhizobium sp. YK2]QYA12157.1 hypothetical protein J5284_16825 [Rhizobium sp. AB2/73]
MRLTESARSSLFTKDRLKRTWERFVREGGKHSTAGIDRVTAEVFQSNISRNIDSLYEQLQSNQYQFSTLRPFLVPKERKGYRIICVPTLSDRLVQKVLVDFLMAQPQAEKLRNAVSFGFMKSIEGSPKGAAAARDRALKLRHDNKWAYKSDISSFFDNIPRSRLIDQTNKLFKKPSLHRLIERSANCEISGGDAVINRIANDLGIKPGLGVRQGMPISPFFSNVILYPFDAKMAAKGFELVRYADDFIVFAKSKEECEVIDQFARTALADFGFSIPSLDADSKTRIAAPDEAIEFLGLSLEPTLANKYELKVGVKQIDKIKNNLGALKDIDQLSSKNLTVTDITSKIENRIAGYKAAYASASNISELDAIFAKARSDTLKSIYSAIFGQDAVKNLGIKQAMILGLQPYPLERSAGRKSRKRH